MNKRKTHHAPRAKAVGVNLAKQDIDAWLVGNGYTLVRTSRPEMTIVKMGNKDTVLPRVFADQMAKTLVMKIGEALVRPGLNRTSVFKSRSAHSGTPIFAYSIDPADPSRFIREDESGARTLGRMIDGSFSPIHAQG
ncbi:MAG: hypothetical protein Q7T13_05260 [Polaromonas sp.]|nr:hypothetical protein [Polaromonas sp.]